MSRIGKLPIAIPAGVTVDIKDDVITVKGKLGELSQKFGDGVILEMEDGQLHVKPNEATTMGKPGAMHGLYRALIANMVKGVSEGFETVQEFVGVGYKAEAKDKSSKWLWASPTTFSWRCLLRLRLKPSTKEVRTPF